VKNVLQASDSMTLRVKIRETKDLLEPELPGDLSGRISFLFSDGCRRNLLRRGGWARENVASKKLYIQLPPILAGGQGNSEWGAKIVGWGSGMGM
jgi:hypothetical protein